MGIEVGFDLTTDAGGMLGGISDAARGLGQLSVTAKATESQIQQSFNRSAQEVSGFSKELTQGSKTVGQFIDQTKKLSGTKDAANSLRTEIMKLTKEAVNLKNQGDFLGADQLIKKAGKIKEELVNVQKAIRDVGGNASQNLASGFGAATSLITQGFEGVLAVQSLVGVKSEDFEKQLLRLQGIAALSNIAREFGDISGKVSQIKIAFEPLKALYTSANEALLNFGKTGQAAMAENAAASGGFFSGIKSGVTSAIGSLKSLWAAMIANPLGVVLAAVAALAAAYIYLKETAASYAEALREVILKSEKDLEAEMKTNKTLIEGRIAVMEAELDVIKASKAPLDEQLKKMKEINQLKKEDIAQDLIAADVKAFNTKRSLDALEAEKQSFYSYLKLQLTGINDLEERQQKIKELKQVLDGQTAEAQKFKDSIHALDIKGNADEKTLRDQAAKAEEERQNKRKELHRAVTDAIKELYQKTDKAILDTLSGEDKIKKEQEIGLKEVAEIKKNILDKIQAENDYIAKLKGKKAEKAKLTQDQEKQIGILEQAIYAKTTDDLLALQAKRVTEQAQQLAKEGQLEVGAMNQAEAAAILAMEKIQQGRRESDEHFEAARQRAVLQTQVNFAPLKLQAQLDQFKAEKDATEIGLKAQLDQLHDKNDTEAQIKKQALLDDLDFLQRKYAQESEVAKTATDKTVNDLKKQLDDLEKSGKGKGVDILALLGIDEKSLKAVQQTVSEVTGFADELIQAKQDQLDAQIQQTETEIANRDKNISSIQSEIDAKQSALEKEIGLGQKGLANNSDKARQELQVLKSKLTTEQAAKNAALQQEAKANEQKKALAREQIIIDSVAQGMNMITAATNVYKSLSAIPVVGAVLAPIAVAAMIAAFVAQKATALAAVDQQAPKFAEGGIDIAGPGTGTSDSINARISRGESVITARRTREHKTLLSGIHLNDDRMISEGILDTLKNRRSVLEGVTEELIHKKDIMNAINTKVSLNTDRMERQLSDLNDKYSQALSESRNKVYTDQQGNLVIVKGSHTVVQRRRAS